MKMFMEKSINRLLPSKLEPNQAGFGWAALIEAALLLTVLLAVSYFYLPGDSGLFSLKPHPFWIIIILISVRFGLLESLLCALFTAFVYSSLKIFTWDGDFYYSSLRLWADFKEPLLFILVAVVISGYRENLIKRIENLSVAIKEKIAEISIAERDLLVLADTAAWQDVAAT